MKLNKQRIKESLILSAIFTVIVAVSLYGMSFNGCSANPIYALVTFLVMFGVLMTVFEIGQFEYPGMALFILFLFAAIASFFYSSVDTEKLELGKDIFIEGFYNVADINSCSAKEGEPIKLSEDIDKGNGLAYMITYYIQENGSKISIRYSGSELNKIIKILISDKKERIVYVDIPWLKNKSGLFADAPYYNYFCNPTYPTSPPLGIYAKETSKKDQIIKIPERFLRQANHKN